MSSNSETVDVRGLSCPQPIMLANKAIKKLGQGTIEVLADSGTARDNVTRIAENSGWSVTVEDKPGGEYKLVLKK